MTRRIKNSSYGGPGPAAVAFPSGRHTISQKLAEAPVMGQTTQYAISLKQPWATLVVSGLKTIEVRKWSTARRGRVLIHAARISDPRSEAWALVPAELQADAQLVGGLVGAVDVVGCKTYRDRE